MTPDERQRWFDSLAKLLIGKLSYGDLDDLRRVLMSRDGGIDLDSAIYRGLLRGKGRSVDGLFGLGGPRR
jgi:hypothetical protein